MTILDPVIISLFFYCSTFRRVIKLFFMNTIFAVKENIENLLSKVDALESEISEFVADYFCNISDDIHSNEIKINEIWCKNIKDETIKLLIVLKTDLHLDVSLLEELIECCGFVDVSRLN